MATDGELLRLLHVFATFDAAGPQVRTLDVCRAVGDGLLHRFVAADGRTGAGARLDGVHHAGVHALRRPASALAQVRELLAVQRAYRPDLVLTYNWGAMLGALAAWIAGVPFVHHEEVVPADELQRPVWRRERLRRWLLARAQAVVVPSRLLAERARTRWAVPAARVHRVANGVDPRRHRPAERRGHGAPTVGCVAHARVEKNLPRLLRAFAGCTRRDVRLRLVGGGPLLEHCRDAARALGIDARVDWCGACDDTAAHYAAMDVFVLPSDDEQMPLALLEAMAHGLPVIATRVGEVAAMLPLCQQPFLVEPGPGADAAIAGHLDTLLGDGGLRARLGQENRAQVQRDFDVARVAVRYGELYRAAAGAGARRLCS